MVNSGKCPNCDKTVSSVKAEPLEAKSTKMYPYFFSIKVLPSSDRHPIKGGQAHVWVMDQNLDSAQIRAIDYLRKHHWEAQEIELAERMQPEQLAQMDKREEPHLLQAQRHGIGCSVLGWKS